jgi:short-subunit dehydrogenase
MILAGNSGMALVTGGSSGIGYAIACELAKRNYNLVIVSNEEIRLIKACEQLVLKYKIEAIPVFMDLSETDAANKLYDWCWDKNIRVDLLVNNAGIFFFGEVVKTKVGKVKEMISLHTTTPALLCTLFGKDMKERRAGHILIISSLSAYMPYPGIALYSSTKRFLKSFSRSLKTEMRDYHVNVSCVCPGAVSTGLYDLSESARRKALRTGIMMSPEKLARKTVNAMFRRRSLLIPGFLNRLIFPLLFIVPHGIIALIRRKSGFLPPDMN